MVLFESIPFHRAQSFAIAHKFLPTLEDYITTVDGQKGWTITFYSHDADGNPVKDPISSFTVYETKIRLNDFLPEGITPTWSITLRGVFTPVRTGPFELGMAVSGKARLYLDDDLALEMWENQTAGEFYYGSVVLPLQVHSHVDRRL